MKLVIQHSTVYRYEAPANYTIQYLHLTPRPAANQNILRWRLETPGQAREMIDAYGNIMHVLVVDEPHQEIAIRVIGEAETADTSGVMSGDGEPLPIDAYRGVTPLTAPDATLHDLVAPLRPRFAKDRLDGLHELSRRIAKAVKYRQGQTDAESTAAQALARKSGVCQDQAHVFIAAARALGVPARYVSGYVHVGSPDSGEDASHAWAEAWVDSLGWVGFDVANQICPTEAHLRLAVGLDYLACAPVRGIRRGGGEENLAVSVSVGKGRWKMPTADTPRRPPAAAQDSDQQ
jgi:transglutaminase-like putative cysteine protease